MEKGCSNAFIAIERSRPSPWSVTVTTTPFVEHPGGELHPAAARGVAARVVEQLADHAADPRAVGDRAQLVGHRGVDRRVRILARPTSSTACRINGARSIGATSSSNVPRSSSAIVMISSTIPISLSSEAWSWPRNCSRSSSGTAGFRKTYAMPFATVTGVRSSWEMFARKSALADVPCVTEDRSSRARRGPPARRRSPAPPRAPKPLATTGRQHHRAGQRRADRREQRVGPVLAQHVPGGAGAEHLGDDGRVPRGRARDHPRAGRRGAQTPHQLRPRRAPPARGPRSPRRGAPAPRTRRLGRGPRSRPRRDPAPPATGGTAGRRPRRRRRTRARSIPSCRGIGPARLGLRCVGRMGDAGRSA